MKKANRAVYALRFIKTCSTQELRKRLVTVLVIPHLDYCSVVYLDVSAELTNSGIRYIYGVVRMCERITSFRISLGLLRTDTRSLYFAAILMYKILRLNKHKYLAAFVQRYQSRGPTRDDHKDLAIPGVWLDTGLLSFQVRSAHRWNCLPSRHP